jgi:hypothetical protein
MKVGTLVVFVVSVVCGTGVTHAEEKSDPAFLRDLFAGIARLPGLTAEYREEKRFSMLVEPVVSKGTVLFIPPGELIRVTREPVWSSLVVRPNSVVYTDASGKKKLPLDENHQARIIAQAFVSVVRGDLKALEKNFVVTCMKDPDKTTWRVRLQPKPQTGPAGLVSVEIRGKDLVVASMAIEEANGDRTNTTFWRVDTSSRPSAKQVDQATRKPQ